MAAREEDRAERWRQAVPEVLKNAAQIVVDNPGQCALLLAAAVTAAAAARNLVRPRTLAEAFALAVVVDVGYSWAAAAAIDRGLITFRFRDADGQLVPWRPRGDDGTRLLVFCGVDCPGHTAEPPGSSCVKRYSDAGRADPAG